RWRCRSSSCRYVTPRAAAEAHRLSWQSTRCRAERNHAGAGVYSPDAAADLPRSAAVASHLLAAGASLTDWVSILISAALALLGSLGLAYWSFRAQNDRSALVGLYLIFGAPALLLLIAGFAVLFGGDTVLGRLSLLIGLGLGLPLLPPFRQLLSRVTPLDPESTIDM